MPLEGYNSNYYFPIFNSYEIIESVWDKRMEKEQIKTIFLKKCNVIYFEDLLYLKY